MTRRRMAAVTALDPRVESIMICRICSRTPSPPGVDATNPPTFDKVIQPVHQIKRMKVMPFTEVSMACHSTIKLAPRRNQQSRVDKSPRKKERKDPGITSSCSAGKNRFPNFFTMKGKKPGMMGIPVTSIKKIAAVICVVEVSGESKPRVTARAAPVAIVKSTS